jgi:membrane protein required for colicin V production
LKTLKPLDEIFGKNERMILDLVFAVVVVLAIFKGYRRGLIVGIFSFIAIIVGLAAALKLSAVVAGHIGKSVKVSDQWLPVISFIIVFVVIVLLVRLGANFIQRTAEVAMLGWVNRLGGILLYLAIYVAVFSVLLFYAEKLQLLRQSTIDKSVTYSYIRPLGPRVMDAFGSIVPFFRNMFAELENFFDGISHKI